jgi:hypothetical protein
MALLLLATVFVNSLEFQKTVILSLVAHAAAAALSKFF